MAEDMRGKTDDLYSNDWSSDYFCFSLLNVPIKEPSGFVGLWMMKL